MKNPTWSIVTINFHSATLILDLLKSLQRFEKEFELVVIDHSHDKKLNQALDLVSAKTKLPIIYQSQNNLGFSAGCNLGAKLATGEKLLFLNPDTLLVEPILAGFDQAWQRHKKAVIMAPNLIDASGDHFAQQGSTILNPWNAWWTQSIMHALWPTNPVATQHLQLNRDWEHDLKIDVVPGSAWAIRRKDFKKLHGMDENFFLYYEENDFCRRANKIGEVWWLANPRIFHLWEGTTKHAALDKLNQIDTQKIMTQSRWIYFKKYYGWLGAALTTTFLNITKLDLIIIAFSIAILWFKLKQL